MTISMPLACFIPNMPTGLIYQTYAPGRGLHTEDNFIVLWGSYRVVSGMVHEREKRGSRI